MRSSLRNVFARLLVAGGMLGVGTAMAQDQISPVSAYAGTTTSGSHSGNSSMGNHHGNHQGWNHGHHHGWNHHSHHHGWNHHHHSHHGGGHAGNGNGYGNNQYSGYGNNAGNGNSHNSGYGNGNNSGYGNNYNSGNGNNFNSGNGSGFVGASVSYDARTQTMTSTGPGAGVMWNGYTKQSYAWGPNQPMTVISNPSGITAYPILNMGSSPSAFNNGYSGGNSANNASSANGSHSQRHRR